MYHGIEKAVSVIASQMCLMLYRPRGEAGFTVVTEFVGHGIGRQLHEEPQVPTMGGLEGPCLQVGMVLPSNRWSIWEAVPFAF